jgi:D-tyrosyl-tRNA(Tyr) deacylase
LIALIQRVVEARVTVDGEVVGAIGRGVLAFIGVVPADTAANGERLLARVLQYRIFADDQGRMNRSLKENGGGLMLVPQFTLAADTGRGNRPGFSTAATPAQAETLFTALTEVARNCHAPVATGIFRASMRVSLTNDGPVTFWLEA